ncbi:MAG: ABC transporter ATP-binding protein [Candidatus Odinarchaeum yellowstonii]|uniref:ABC transporter ATP-binding protein n=1 Tax=Odinarchaeota yellowstonii (strain LCB_4) TaxID=1841599 RepID=A0AAF0D2W7_ODILC|nr:MAG: ABC transporter ATP-binding protein [Candidatus Odinarchaeum yellowstonii]
MNHELNLAQIGLEKEVVVETVNLSRYYKRGDQIIKALDNVSVKIYRGEPTAIMGPSGSGKTTFLNLIGLLDKPSSGTILINGQNVTLMSNRQIVDLRRHTIGFVFQFYNLIDVLTAGENVELPLLIAGVKKKERAQRTAALLSLVGLSDRFNHLPDELSGGEQQRVAIARALANNPSLILADEPTGDLDSKTGRMVMKILLDSCKERNIGLIVVTHDSDIANMTDRILFLRDGRLIGESRPVS